MDTILGHGSKICFVILGISYQKWLQKLQDNVKNLQFHDVQVLALEVLEQTKGTILASIINNLTSTIGQPLQIISDHGPDIKKGIELHIKSHPKIIYTYDFTHQVSLWFKEKTSKDQQFDFFLRECRCIRSRIHRTPLYFLRPPISKSRARYHNVDILINWAQNVFQFWEKQDFFEIYPRNSVGKKIFLREFSLLLRYEEVVETYAGILFVYNSAKKLLNENGLHQNSLQDWLQLTKNYPNYPEIQSSIQQVCEYLIIESQKVPLSITLPTRADIIESLFAKYRSFASLSPHKEINEMILSLFLFTTRITPEKILKALENITNNDVITWIEDTFSPSFFARRKEAFFKS